MVAIDFLKEDGSEYGCSGTIISPADVLTAAHCVVDSETGEVFTSHTVQPGFTGDEAPYGDFAVLDVVYWEFWVGAPYSQKQVSRELGAHVSCHF